MGIEVTCDRCCKDTDEIFCGKCSSSDDAGMSDVLADDVHDLAAAIRRGDRADAEALLDRISADLPGWTDQVSLGRYSSRARVQAA